jgi:EAL domain-containing protein (putative c-di-GMP-specific phosphodiesterase class I)
MLERVENLFLLQTIIDMGKKLNYSIVVEGIETPQQLEALRSIDPNIDFQGYLVSRPLQEESFSRLFLNQPPNDKENPS